ncbi:MAG: hypothetical protein ACRDVM_05360 [Acidimicrobiia bacterium]
MSRSALGWGAALVVAVGVTMWAWPGLGPDTRTTGGVLTRAGLVLGAVWVALPELRRASWRTLALGVGAAVLVAWRPALLWLLLPTGVAVLLARSRGRQR